MQDDTSLREQLSNTDKSILNIAELISAHSTWTLIIMNKKNINLHIVYII